jgi:hypothetical protein
MLGIGHATDHHHRAVLLAEEWLGGHKQERSRITRSERRRRVVDEGHPSALEGRPERGTFAWCGGLFGPLGAGVGVPTDQVDRLLTTLDLGGNVT